MMRTIKFSIDPVTNKLLKKSEIISPLTLMNGGIEVLPVQSFPSGLNIVENSINDGINILYKTDFHTKYVSHDDDIADLSNVTESTTTSVESYLVSQTSSEDAGTNSATVITTIRVLWFANENLYKYRDLTFTLTIQNSGSDSANADKGEIHTLTEEEYNEMVRDKLLLEFDNDNAQPAYTVDRYSIYFYVQSNSLRCNFANTNFTRSDASGGFCKNTYYRPAVRIPSSESYLHGYIKEMNILIQQIDESITAINTSITALQEAVTTVSKYFITR